MLIFRRIIVLTQHLVSSPSLGDCSVHRLREDSGNLCIEQSPKKSDDTRCCTNTSCPNEDEHNSARNMYRNIVTTPDAALIQLST